MKSFLLAACALAAVPALAHAPAQPVPQIPGVTPVPGVTPAMPGGPGMGHMPMMMPNRAVTRADVTRHVQQMFAMLDANRDGAIDRAEVAAIHNRMQMMHGQGMMPGGGMGAAPMDRNGIFDRLDTNRDGQISRDEFSRGPAPGQGMGMRRMMIMRGNGTGLFDRADANRDGRVTLQEATALALRHFDAIDRNRDGKITPDERPQRRMMRMRAMRMS